MTKASLLQPKGISVVFFWTWFAASEPPATDEPEDSNSAVDKATELLKTGVEKARPVVDKAGSLAVEGGKKVGAAVASGSRWLTAKVKELVEQRRGDTTDETSEVAEEAVEEENPPT